MVVFYSSRPAGLHLCVLTWFFFRGVSVAALMVITGPKRRNF